MSNSIPNQFRVALNHLLGQEGREHDVAAKRGKDDGNADDPAENAHGPEARAVDATLALAFDGQMPAEVNAVLAAATGADRVALALASPEFQLN